MGRGLSQRRREKNFNSAKQAKAGIVPLPPPPDEVERSTKRRKVGPGSEHLSASFRKMMTLKAVAEHHRGLSTSKQVPANAKVRKNKFRAEMVQKMAKTGSQTATPFVSGPPNVVMGSTHLHDDPSEVGPNDGQMPKYTKQVPGLVKHKSEERGSTKKTLKARKKDFLNKKKLKRKGKLPNAAGKDDDSVELEERVMVDANKPAFGEQAMQPIKINLKRKHWTGEALPETKAKERIKQVFLKQMESARRKEADKVQLAETFREQKKSRSGSAAAAATPATLAALVRRNVAVKKQT